MADLKEYSGIIMVPHVVTTTQRSLKAANAEMLKYLNEHSKSSTFVVLDHVGTPVDFHPKLSFVQEGDLRNEQPDKRA